MKQVLIALVVGVLVVIGLAALLQPRDKNAPPAMEIPPSSASSNLNNTSWTVVAIGSEDVAGAGITVNFADGTISGSDGCNRYSTTYSTDEQSLHINPNMAGTMMACPEADMMLASLFSQTLAQVSSYQLEENTLWLKDSEGEIVLTLTAVPQELSGTSWLVTGVNNGKGAVSSLIVGTEISLDFPDSATVSGNSGCNSYSGSYQESGNTIQVGSVASTMRLCIEPEGIDVQETAYLQALNNARTFSIEGNTLTMRDDQGAMQISAQRK